MFIACPSQVGFNLLVDRTGRLLHVRKKVCKKDIAVNPRVAHLALNAQFIQGL